MNDFYQEISIYQLGQILFSSKKSEGLTSFEIEKIKSLGFTVRTFDASQSFVVKIKRSGLHYNLYKFEDEWFYLQKEEVLSTGEIKSYYYKYYKCDQFEGVIKLLEDSKTTKLIKESINSFYKEISRMEFEEGARKEASELTKNEYEVIDSITNKYFHPVKRIETSPQRFYFSLEYKQKNNSDGPRKNVIYKVEDEWFYVAYRNSNTISHSEFYNFFLCDQFEGLIKFLKDVALAGKSDPEEKRKIIGKVITNKPIKIRESHSIEKKYEEITPKEYTRYTSSHQHILLDDKEKKLLSQTGKFSIPGSVGDFRSRSSIDRSQPYYMLSSSAGNLIINKLEDEWYYIQYAPSAKFWPHQGTIYFRCDQFEGFQEFILDYFSIKEHIITQYKIFNI